MDLPLGWLARALRWVGDYLSGFRPPFDVEWCVGTYHDGHGPKRDLLAIRYELQVVNREEKPNSIRAIRFRFQHRDVGVTEIDDVSFSGLNIGPRATESHAGTFQLSSSILQYGAGDARVLGGEVILVPAFGKPVEGSFCLLPPHLFTRKTGREDV